MGKVVSLSDYYKEKEQAEAKELGDDQATLEDYFERIAAENKDRIEKLKKERLNTNRNVLRSYRIKP